MKKVIIELYTAPGCSRCLKSKDVIEKVLPKYKNVVLKIKSILDEPEKMVKFNIMMTPVIFINNKLVFNKIPSEEEFEMVLKKVKD